MSSINVFVPVALAAERMIPSGTNRDKQRHRHSDSAYNILTFDLIL
jgi:hypothetical protein